MAQWRRCLPLECEDLIQISRTYGKTDAEHTCTNPSLHGEVGDRDSRVPWHTYTWITRDLVSNKVKIKDWYLRLSFDLHTYTLPGNQALIPTTHWAANNHPQLQFENPALSWTSKDRHCMYVAYRHICRHDTHTQNKTLKEKEMNFNFMLN